MKKLNYILFLILFPGSLFSISLYEFSENQKIYIKEIILNGLSLMNREEVITIMKIDKEQNVFVYDIQNAFNNLSKSGFLKNVNYTIESNQEGYNIILTLEENSPLESIKVLDNKLLDLTILKKKLKDNNIEIGKAFSSVALEQAIDDFNIFNQNFGIFLYDVTYKIITKDDIEKIGGKFLFDQEEITKKGIHIIVYIKEIPRVFIKDIKFTNTTISYLEILNVIKLKKDTIIDKDNDLFFMYKRLRRLGFFENVYFKLLKLSESSFEYRLVITTKQIQLSEISTIITAPPNIGIITSVEYYNISLFNTLQRFKAGAGWELSIGAPTFLLEYTHPYFWEGLFFDATFKKTDQVDIIQSSNNKKYTNIYDITLTSGLNIYGNIFSYLFQKERYSLINTVDSDFNTIIGFQQITTLAHSTGLFLVYDSLDDNFFITQGLKVFMEYETYWQALNSHKLGLSGEIYLPIPVFHLVAAVDTRSYILFTKDKNTSLALDDKMRTNVQEITDINDQQVKFTTYSSLELRFPLPEIKNIVKDLSFILFAETGGAWSDYGLTSLQEFKYGYGIGLRLSPKKHYSSFLFQFPAGLYLGYRTGDKKATPTLISHRDSLYYINLTASY